MGSFSPTRTGARPPVHGRRAPRAQARLGLGAADAGQRGGASGRLGAGDGGLLAGEEDPEGDHVPLALDAHPPAELDPDRAVRVLGPEQVGGALAALDVAGDRRGLHAAGRVDRVAEEGVLGVAVAHHARHARAGAQADADPDRPAGRVVLVDEGLRRGALRGEGEAGHDEGVVRRLVEHHVGGAEVGVADGLYLVHAQPVGDAVEAVVEAVQQAVDLLGRDRRRDVGEAHNVGEVHGDGLLALRRHFLAPHERVGDGGREEVAHDLHGLVAQRYSCRYAEAPDRAHALYPRNLARDREGCRGHQRLIERPQAAIQLGERGTALGLVVETLAHQH